MSPFSMNPIGKVRSSRAALEDDDWDHERSVVELDPALYAAESLRGLGEFSHAEIFFFMDQVDPEKIESSARHPRNQTQWPNVGIFAQRGKNRPNQIGHTVCRILRITELTVEVDGLDAVDGTPVLDIKPAVREFQPRGEFFQPPWMTELMRHYWTKSARGESSIRPVQEAQRSEFLLSTDADRLCLDTICAFLARSHWAAQRSRSEIEKSIAHSLNYGIYHGSQQVAFARVVTDHSTFAYLCDVFVDEGFRGRGLSRWLMENVMAHPALQKLRRFTLATKDAHGLYEKFGFHALSPEENRRFMSILKEGT